MPENLPVPRCSSRKSWCACRSCAGWFYRSCLVVRNARSARRDLIITSSTVVHFRLYIYIRARVGVHVHSCRRILFICTVQSLYYLCVYHSCFLTLACVCVGGLEVGFVSPCSWLAHVTGVVGYVLAGVEIGVLCCIFLYFCGC